jgi:hypothetical protein
MCADDSAIRRHGPTALLSALLTLAGADAMPSHALGASTVGIVARVSRLAEPNTTARRLRANVLLGVAASVVLGAPLLTAWTAASSTLSACAFMP